MNYSDIQTLLGKRAGLLLEHVAKKIPKDHLYLPGADLIIACRKAAIPMQIIPGPCALIAALSLYGIKGPFQFIGFLEKRRGALVRQLIEMFYYRGTSVAYLSPHTLLKTLTLIPDNREIFLARELTKLYEEMVHGPSAQLLSHFQKRGIRGEFVLILPPGEEKLGRDPHLLMEELQELFGIEAREAMVVAAKLLHRPKRDFYDSLHRSRLKS